jgi:hypothetical protein
MSLESGRQGRIVSRVIRRARRNTLYLIVLSPALRAKSLDSMPRALNQEDTREPLRMKRVQKPADQVAWSRNVAAAPGAVALRAIVAPVARARPCSGERMPSVVRLDSRCPQQPEEQAHDPGVCVAVEHDFDLPSP